jgi:hypothetical protein
MERCEDGTFCIASGGVLSRGLDMSFNWRYPVHASFKANLPALQDAFDSRPDIAALRSSVW